MRSKIQSQAILLSIVPLAFLLVFLGVVALLVNRTAEMTVWTAHASKVLDQSDTLYRSVTDANRAAVDYTQHPGKGAFNRYTAAKQMVLAQAQELVRLSEGSPQKDLAVAYAAATRRITGVLDSYLADLRAGRGAQARALVAAPSTRAVATNFQTAKANFDRAQRRSTSGHFRALRDQIRNYGFVLLIGTFAGIILTLLTTARFGIRIAGRLRQLADNAERLGSGRMTVPVQGDDEIAELDRVYHEMTQRIQDTLSAYRREHDIASTLQRALLPQELPQLPGLRIDTAYAAAAHAGEIGGDWYDVFTLDHHVVGISVGDVAGHGVRAAAIMGSLRQIIRTAARVDSEPATVLHRANAALCADEDVIVTAFFATLDMRTGKMLYAVAGHPLPLAVRSSGAVEQLSGEGLMLGVEPQTRYQTFQATLRQGEGIICFTDGIVEVERDYLKGMETLIEVARAEYSHGPENIAERIKSRILAQAEPVDDSAVLFVGLTDLVG